MRLQHRLCNPGSSMLHFSPEQSFIVQLQIVRGGNSNGLYTAATQVSLLYSQINQVLRRMWVITELKQPLQLHPFLVFLVDAYPHIFLPQASLASIQSSLSAPNSYPCPEEFYMQRTGRAKPDFFYFSFKDLFMLLFLLLLRMYMIETLYKKYIFFSLESFSSDKQQIKFTDLQLAYLDNYNLLN